MRLEIIAVFEKWDIDYENKTINGLTVGLLNSVDLVKVDGVVIPHELFSKSDWFDKLTYMLIK